MAKEMIQEASNALSKEVANMKKSDISPIREDLETLRDDAMTLRDDAKVLGRDLKTEGKRQLNRAEEKAKEAMEVARERGQDQFAEMARFVQSNPGQSLAIAFVGGIIASMILGGRR